MAKLPRVTSILFGSTAPAQTVEEYGSKTQLGTPNYTTDPAQIQQLAAWTDGWTAAIATGNKAPYVQDMNAFCLVDSYQLAYIFQSGIAEWDSATTYYLGSYVQDPAGSGDLWYSLQNNNLNNAPPVGASNAFWKLFTALPPVSTRQTFLTGSGTYTTPTNIRQLRIRVIGGGGSGGPPTDALGATGNAGGNSSFNSIVANGGSGGGSGFVSGAASGQPGAGGVGGSGSASIRVAGNAGVAGVSSNSSRGFSGTGGAGVLGGAGAGAAMATNNGAAAASNSGAGGGGGRNGDEPGAGGGAGEYIELIINSPSATYSYAVGAGGAAKGDGSGFTGGAGGSGVIIVDEFY